MVDNYSMLSIDPIQGSELGGTLIKVQLNVPIDANLSLSCCFNETKVRVGAESDYGSESVISCLSPPSRPGTVHFTITADECMAETVNPYVDSYVSPRTTFEYTIMATVFFTGPKIGSENTQVEIVGSGFRNTTDLSCRFGQVSVPAQFISDSRLICYSPQFNRTGSVPLAVSNNGVDVEGDWADAKFKYIEAPLITSIDPVAAPLNGGTTLFVRGYHFRHQEISSVFCKFDEDIVVNATLLGNNEIACITPVFGGTLGRSIAISISVDGGYNFYEGTNVALFVHLPSGILLVYPRSAPDTGNSLVKVFGRHFPRSPQLACQFGDETVFAVWKSTSLVECITPSVRSGMSAVRISTNGQNSGLSNYVPFLFFDATTLTSIHPKQGPVYGGSTVFVQGTGFANNPTFVCCFGNVCQPAISVLNSTAAQCRVPKLNSDDHRTVAVEVSANNGQDFTSLSKIHYTYIPLTLFIDIVPRMGPESGGTVLTLFGDFGQVKMSEISCRFSSHLISSTLMSEIFTLTNGSIQCKTPPYTPMNENQPSVTSLDIVLTEDPTVTVVSNPITFTFYPKINVSSIAPNSGSELGGTNVTIFGNFLRTNEIGCKFDYFESPFSKWLSKSSVVCTSPPAESSFLYTPRMNLSIALNGIDYEKAGVFSYVAVSHISSITPSFGPVSGGTTLFIRGEGFIAGGSNMVFCLIGKSLTEAEVISSSLLKCRVPPSTLALSVPVQITFDEGHQYITSDSNFTYVLQPSIHDIIPSFVPATEKTTVHVYGENFSNIFGNNLWLSFGNTTMKGKLVNDSIVTFTSPLFEGSKSSYLRMSTNGVDYSSSGPIFSVLKPPVISKISPLFSHEHGGVKISIEGSGFHNNKFLSCKFRFHGWEVVVDAQYISPLLIQCVTPELKTPSIGKVSVELSTIGNYSSANHFFDINYYPSVSIVSVSPSFFPVTGGSHLEVIGMGFRQQDEALYCDFDVNGPNHIYVKAQVDSDEFLRCTTPLYPRDVAGEIYESNIALAVQHEDSFFRAARWTEYSVNIFIHEAILMDKVSPDVVDAGGGATINVYGENFVNSTSLSCSFTFEDQKLFECASFHSSTVISCDVPRVLVVPKRSLTISHVQITNNGKDFATKGLPLYHRFPFELEEIHPKAASEDGGVNVTLFGNFFFPDETLSCDFVGGRTHIKTQARLKTSQIVQCTVPLLEPGPYSVTVSTANVNSAKDLILDVFPRIELTLAVPELGPISGGTRITISGQTFINTTDLSCWFGDSAVKATFLSAAKVECRSPPSYRHEPHEVDLTISQNGLPVPDNALLFTYAHLPEIDMASPCIGTVSEGSQISVHGHFLTHEVGNTVVRVGDLFVDADSAEFDRVEFSIPDEVRSTKSTRIPVAISSNGGVDFSTSRSYFIVVREASISSVSPQYGLEEGGNLVVLSGENFHAHAHSTAQCRFGAIRVEAFVVSPHHIECIAPKAVSPGPVRLDLSMNGKEWTDESHFYTYEIPFDIFEVEPQIISSAGNAIVHIHGTNFLPDREMFCSFGDAGVRKALLTSTREITCISPVTSLLGAFDFDIISTERVSMLRETIQLDFVALPQLQFWPKFGQMRGGTEVNIVIEERKYGQLGDVDCIFEIKGRQYKVKAQKQNSTLIGCITPEVQMGRADFVSSTLGIYSASSGYLAPPSDTVFTFKKQPSVSEMTPTTGNIKGGTKVRVILLPNYGLFLNSESSLCRFGSTTVKVLWISTAEVVCISPPSSKDMVVKIEIADNGLDFMHVGVFSYSSPPALKSISPIFGFTQTQVEIRVEVLEPIVTGEKLDEVQCLFKTAIAEHKIVNGKMVNSTEFLCQTPLFSEEGDVQVFISTNGQDFSDTPLLYQVEEPIRVTSFSPESGFRGLQISIRLQGRFPSPLLEWRCVLENTGNRSIGRIVAVSPKEIQCEVSCPKESQGTFRFLLEAENSSSSSRFQTAFKCDPLPELKNVEPSVIVTNEKHIMVLVRGSDFRPGTFLSCSFSNDLGIQNTRAAYLNDNAVACETPVFHREGIVHLGFSNNDQDFTEQMLSIEIIEPPLVANIIPREIVAGESFLIEGNFGNHGSKASCNIGKTNLYLRVINEGQIQCKTPTGIQTQQNALFQITFEGLDLPILNGTSIVDVVGRPVVSEIHPSQALRFHEEQVVVRGRNLQFGASKSVSCHFGDASVEGYIKSDSEVICNSPLSLANARVSFKLQVGSVYATNTRDHSFLHMNPWIIDEVIPRSGTTDGNSDIRIFGKEFMVGVAVNCRFGAVSTPATVMSETLVKCRTPTQYPGPVDIQLELRQSGNLISMPNKALMNTTKFYFYPKEDVISISPTIGLALGGTDIYINGTWTFDSVFSLEFLSPICKFGDQKVEAFFTPSRMMSCKTPSSLLVDSTTVEIYTSLNGFDSIRSHITFRYQGAMQATSISPRKGPRRGGTLVTISVSASKTLTEISCRFGTHASTYAYFDDAQGTIACQTPTADRDGEVEIFLKFGPSETWYGTGKIFKFEDDFALRSISPKTLSERGGDLLYIEGEGFEPFASIHCRFGSDADILARRLSWNTITCTCPSLEELGFEVYKSFKISVTSNLVEYIDVPGFFQYVPDATIHNIIPFGGPSRGGTTITVHGSDFLLDSVSLCWFEGYATIASVLSETTISCQSCPYHLGEEHLQKVKFSITQGNRTVASSRQFLYYETPLSSDLTLTPSSIPVDGMSSVMLGGGPLIDLLNEMKGNNWLPHMRARLDSKEVEAVYNGLGVSCKTPKVDSTKSLAERKNSTRLEFSFNGGVDYTMFKSVGLYRNPNLLSLHPPTVIQGFHKHIYIEMSRSHIASIQNISCRIGNVITKGDLLSGTHIACALPMTLLSLAFEVLVPVSISMNNHDFSADALPLTFKVPPLIMEDTPRMVAEVGHSNVVVTGDHFNSLAECGVRTVCVGVRMQEPLSCVPFEVRGDNSFTFQAPPGQGLVSLYYQVDISSLVDTGVRLKYLKDVHIDTLRLVGPEVDSNVAIEVVGRNIDPELNYSCLVYSESKPEKSSLFEAAITATSEVLLCLIPSGQSVDINVRIVRDIDRSLSNSLPFFYNAIHVMENVYPQVVSEDNREIFRIRGLFGNEEAKYCMFDLSHGERYFSLIESISSTIVECFAPRKLSIGISHISLSNGKNMYHSNSVPFIIRPRRVLVDIYPSHGPMTGGTLVKVSFDGEVFASNETTGDFLCNFGGVEVNAHVLDPLLVSCRSPPFIDTDGVHLKVEERSSQGIGSVKVHDNSDATFKYEEPLVITDVLPRRALSSGGAVLEISGAHFSNIVSENVVKFVSLTYPTQSSLSKCIELFQSGLRVVVPAFPVDTHGSDIAIEIANNGVDFVRFATPLSLVPADVQLISVSPSIVPEKSRAKITVKGLGFGKYTGEETLRCRIGDKHTLLHWVSSEEIQCSLPANLMHGNYSVSLLSNGHEEEPTNFALQVIVSPTARISSAYPLEGPFSGGTKVNVNGSGFTATAGMHCDLGGVRIDLMIFNDTHAACYTPPIQNIFRQLYIEKGATNVPISLDIGISHDWLPDVRQEEWGDLELDPVYTYYPDETVDAVYPISIPSSGNTTFVLRGSEFKDAATLSCEVGEALPRKAMFVDSSSVMCPVPSALEAFGSEQGFRDALDGGLAKAFVSVSNNGQHPQAGSAKNVISFTYYETPTFDRVEPLAGPSGTAIRLVTKELPMIENAFCRFGYFELEAEILPPNTIICMSPTLNTTNQIYRQTGIDISLNGVDFNEVAKFIYSDAPIIQKVEPAYGPIVGGNELVVHGANFDNTPSVLCKFGDVPVLAKFVSEQIVTCVAPPHDGGTILVRIFDGNDNTDEECHQDVPSVSYTYLEEMKIFSTYPKHGSTSGNTPLRVIGSNFVSLTTLACAFGENETSPAAFVSENEVTCVVPSTSSDTKKLVSVKIGLEHEFGLTILSNEGTVFTYTPPPFIENVYPARGLLVGGEKVIITGNHFYHPDSDDSIVCSFGPQKVNGTWLSNSQVECITPPMPDEAGARNTQVVSFSHDLPTSFFFNETLFSLNFGGESASFLKCDLNPTDLEMSLKALSTIGDVVVTKDVFHRSKSHEIRYYVTFTTLGLPANAGPIAPIDVSIKPLLAHGVEAKVEVIQKSCCDVRISTNIIDFFGGLDQRIIPFTFDAGLFIHSVQPNHGPQTGGTTVRINGSGISDPRAQRSLIHCIFGNKYVEAVFLDSTSVECITPWFPSPANVTVTLELHSKAEGRGARVDSQAYFEYVLVSRVFSTFPESLPQPGQYAWSELHVIGDNFVPSPMLSCLFEGDGLSKTIDDLTTKRFETPALYINSSSIKCLVPSEYSRLEHLTSSILVSVTTNRYDWTNRHRVEITSPHKVHSITPQSGPNSGGTLVYIEGDNFADTDTLACKFGNETVKSEFRSTSGVTCKSPPNPGLDSTVQITVTNNGKHFTSDFVHFKYYDSFGIKNVNPLIAPSCGGTLVTIQLRSPFEKVWHVYCKFNDTQVIANQEDNRTISCRAPPAHAGGGTVSLEVTRNQFDFSQSGTRFMYLPGHQTESLQLVPSHGPRNGGTLVHVSGYAKMSVQRKGILTNPKCKFNNIVVEVEEIKKAGDIIVCRTPNSHLREESFVLVDISLTGALEDFTDIGANFHYDDEVSIIKLVPDMGSVKGSTPVRVLGGPFAKRYESEISCRFGKTFVPATWQSEREISCTSPPVANLYETHNLTIFSMAWNQEIQSVSLSVDDYVPEIHTISTTGTQLPKGEIQTIEIKGIDDRDEIQQITVGSSLSDTCVLDISFSTKPTRPKIAIVSTNVEKGGTLSGKFKLYMRNGAGYISSDHLGFNASAAQMQKAVSKLHGVLSNVSVVESMKEIDGTKEWRITFPQNIDIPQLLVNGNSLLGSDANVQVSEESPGSVPEIQKISINSTSEFSGTFYLSLKGYRTTDIYWNASSTAVESALEGLPSIRTMSVTHQELYIDPVDSQYRTSWLVTFDSHSGHSPILHTCCDSRDDASVQTLFNIGGFDNVWIQAERMQKGAPEARNDTFQMVFSGYKGGVEVTEPIGTNATEHEITKVLEKIRAVANNSLMVTKTYIDEKIYCARFKITFTPLVLHPLALSSSVDPQIRIKALSITKDATVTMKQYVAKKEVQVLEFLSDAGILSCGDGTNKGLFTFHSSSSGNTIRDTLEALEDRKTGNRYYGDITVKKIALGSSLVKVMLTFDSIIEDRPPLICDSDVKVGTLANGVKRKVFGGHFQLGFNTQISNKIPHNATSADLKLALEAMPGIGEDSLDVSVSNNDDGSRSWKVTFKGRNTRGDISMLDLTLEELEGFNPFVRVVEVKRGSFLVGSYRLKVKNLWSPPIHTHATQLELKKAIEQIPGAHVSIENLDINSLGDPSFTVMFSHYEGEEPNGFIPFTAGDLPLMDIDVTNLTGCDWNVSIHTVQNGTSTIDSDFASRGFRLVPPGISTTYPVEKMTRWLSHNERSSAMKEALVETGASPVGITVNRQGPFQNGSFRWQVEYPLGYTSNGHTWQVIRKGGAAVKLQGEGSGVITALSRQGSKKCDGYFHIRYRKTLQSAFEITSKIPVNASATEVKVILGTLPSVTKVEVETKSLDFAQTGSGAKQWDITFTSLRDIGDVPLLSIDTSKLIGTGVRMNTEERVKGVGNVLFVYEVPLQKGFRIRYGNNISTMFDFEDDIHVTDLQDAINSMSGKRHAVENFKDIGGTTKIFVLPLSDRSIDENTLSLEVYKKCARSMSADGFCFEYNDNGAIWFEGSTSSLQGTFTLEFNSSHEIGSDYLHSCVERTNDISVRATTDELEHSLKQLNLIEDVDVWKVEDLNVGVLLNGRVGENRRYHIVFKKIGVCGKNGNLHFDDLSKRDVSFLKVEESVMSGSPAYDLPASQAFRHMLDQNSNELDAAAGSVPVEISVNRYDFSTSGITFAYSPSFEVHKLHPNHGFHATTILLEGKHFFRSPDLRCHFSDNFQASVPYFHDDGVPIDEYVNETHVICSVPPRQRLSTTSGVFVSIDGFLRPDTEHSIFTYDDPITISEVFPRSGPASGNFTVVIKGNSFKDTDDLSCNFFGTSTVKALFVTATQIECTAPELATGNHPLTITTNGQDFSNEFKMIRFYESVIVDSLYPISGPSKSTGADVHIFGSNFFNSTEMVCKFDATLVPAYYITSHEVRCKSPPIFERSDLQWIALTEHTSGDGFNHYPLIADTHDYPLYLSELVDVEVAMNAQDFTTSGTKYLYQDDVTINSLSSKSGLPTGNTPIFISGSGYVNTTQLSCRFGNQIVRASFLTRNLILCFTPPTSDIEFENASEVTRIRRVGSMDNAKSLDQLPEVFVEVSNNGVDFSDFRHFFEFHRPAPFGSYQMGVEDATILQCPRGAYCSDSGHTNFTLCPMGTFQPAMGQSICRSCDIGFMCPEEGLPVPRLCPAGYVCDVKGIQKPEQPCPEGFFCPAGTATTDTYCGNINIMNAMSLGLSLAERHTTISLGDQLHGQDDILGGRTSICFDNSTDDFGLQSSPYPARVWDELRLLPLDSNTVVSAPIRGRFCLEESCQYIDARLDFDMEIFNKNTQLHRPAPCPLGTYCHPGSSANVTVIGDFSSPQTCVGTNYCPEGSTGPRGIGDCPKGFYCRFGKKYPCPVGSYCPYRELWDPLPCEPGTFNFMVGQVKCSSCPLGHFCNDYGRVDPAICTPGYVCSEKGLASPNMRCQPGYYCPPGTQTSDPFRNDTTLRPYPCRPGSYCLSGCGFDSIVEGNFSHAQPCSAGFYCEAASNSGKGSGLCPPSFVCPKGTATPIPTKKGHYAKYAGTIEAAQCLPGFYAPTIQSSECIPCPPGTTCEEEGLVEAHFCPPGTYRGSLNSDGVPCITCPQGTWSKNWNLRDEGECVSCASGLSCPTDGMTSPCSKKDLPTPFEPVVNLNGIPMPEYNFKPDRRPPSYSVDECLNLNADEGGLNLVQRKSKHHYFFGELVPPYIDILGRGAHIRITDETSIKYGNGAKCYRNMQAKGSLVFEQFAVFYGPQFDIQTGFPHQGYGSSDVPTQFFNTPRWDSNSSLQYFFGDGMSYIPLPRSLKFNPAFNCTPGFSLMNSTLIRKGNKVVYTSATHDFEGGLDVEECSTFDNELNCFIDPLFRVHEVGECCNIERRNSRAIYFADDQYYTGTCEADIICSGSEVLMTEAIPCQDGYVCGERTNSTTSTSVKCPPGYVCEFGTTPDESLEAPRSKYKKLCEHGMFCELDIGVSASESICPIGYFCPPGTSNPLRGTLSDDSLQRGIVSPAMVDPERDVRYLRYFGHDTFGLLSEHDSNCLNGEENSLVDRFESSLQSNFSPHRGAQDNARNKAFMYQSTCGRDNKWKHVLETVRRNECDCNIQLLQIIAVYRLRKVSFDNWTNFISSIVFSQERHCLPHVVFCGFISSR